MPENTSLLLINPSLFLTLIGYIFLLDPSGAQGVTICVSLSVRHKVVKSTESSSFSLRPVLGQSQVSLRSLSLLRIVQTEPKILRLVLRILPLETSDAVAW